MQANTQFLRTPFVSNSCYSTISTNSFFLRATTAVRENKSSFLIPASIGTLGINTLKFDLAGAELHFGFLVDLSSSGVFTRLYRAKIPKWTRCIAHFNETSPLKAWHSAPHSNLSFCSLITNFNITRRKLCLLSRLDVKRSRERSMESRARCQRH